MPAPLHSFLKAALLAALGLSAAFFLWLWMYAVTPAPPVSPAGTGESAQPVQLYIPPGTGLQGIKGMLAERGVIRDDLRFGLLARVMGAAHRLKAGEYLFEPGLTPYQLLQLLEKGMTVRWPVTIPEGVTLAEIADLLASGEWVERDRFLALARDPGYIESLGLAAPTLEGYLFPDTYYLERGLGEEAIITMMVSRLQKVKEGLCGTSTEGRQAGVPVRECTDNPVSSGLSWHEVLTLASIVEKETGLAAERPLVACVFLNRLEKGMRLQADPTVIYGIPDFNGNITRRDLRADTPYNTYVNKGLPPTPIANPGRAAIEAVLHPALAPFLYFVATNNGSHCFSASLAEHNRAVRQFQKQNRAANN